MSQTGPGGLPTCDGVRVFRCKMKPAVESGYLSDLVKEGIGAADYGTGASLDPEKASDDRTSAAKQSFRLLRELSQNIGYGVIEDEDRENVVVGRTTPPCMMLFDAPDGDGGEVTLKGFRFDEFGTVEEDEFGEVYSLLDNRDHLPTIAEVNPESETKGPGREAVLDAFRTLEETGRLRQPTR